MLLTVEVISVFGVPVALLTDRSTNFLSHLIKISQLLGVKKLNTTAYQPVCDGMVGRLSHFERDDTETRVSFWSTLGSVFARFLVGIP